MSKLVDATISEAWPFRVSRSRVSARDRRHAAVHEAGHVVIARHLGIMAIEAEIRKIEPRDFYEKEWIGSVRCQTKGVAAEKRELIAVAGVVAEACWDRQIFEDLADALELDPGEMSDSDWKLSGCLPDEPSQQFWNAMQHAFELLDRDMGKLWKDLLLEARCLIVKSRYSFPALPFIAR